MNQNKKFQLERETFNHHWLLRLRMGVNAIRSSRKIQKFLVIYVLVSLVLMAVRPWLFIWNDDDIFSVMQRTSMGQLFPILSIGGFFLIVVFLGTPIGWKSIQNDLQRVGLVNHAGEVPFLVERYRDSDHPNVTVMEFESCGIPKSEWEDKQEKIETALNVHVAKIREGHVKKRILLYTVPYDCELPNNLNWQEHYLCGDDFELVLGESYLGQVKINLAQIPHILLGGSTGSGKSVLLKLLLMQCLRKGAVVCIADFKGGVDFPDIWQKKFQMIFDKAALLDHV